jgi:MYXO-CTERM domain-containing protein
VRRLGVVLAVLGATSVAAQPYDYLSFRMLNDAKSPFPYYVDSRLAAPAGLSVDGVRAAVDRAWGTWNAVACASPKAVSRGLTAGVVPNPPDPYDLYSVTPVWISSQSDPDFAALFGTGLVQSVTLPVSYAGVLLTCDTYLNAATKSWSLEATPAAGTWDVETVMLHELGHCLGLGHSSGTPDNVMWADMHAGDLKRQLGAGDQTALCQRNPASGATGAPCETAAACGASPSLKCLAQPETQGLTLSLCTHACTVGTGGGCEVPMTCQGSSAFVPDGGACLLPGTSTTQVGKACAGPSDCSSGLAICRGVPAEMTAGSGSPFWEDGYCTQACDLGHPECPPESLCVRDDRRDPRCLATCRLGLSDCRPGYACAKTENGVGVCWPRCYTDADCADPGQDTCRTCDGLCVPKNGTGQIGDECTAEAQCGPGQVCRTLSANSTKKVCTQQCARGCGTCPSSSTCTPVTGGELLCLKDCTGPGTCPSELRCSVTSTGRACIAPCTKASECEPGQVCSDGECVTPVVDDGGCQVLCTPIDAGHPVTPGRRDAGTGGGDTGSAGCGCATSDGWLGLGGFLALLLLRRRPWRAA